MRHVEWINTPNRLGQTTGWKLYRLDRDWAPTGDTFVAEAEVRQEIEASTEPLTFYGYGPLESDEPTLIYGGNGAYIPFEDVPVWQGYVLVAGKGWEVLGDAIRAPEDMVQQLVKRAAQAQGLQAVTRVLGYGPVNQDRPTVVYSGTFFDNPPPLRTPIMEGGLPMGLPAQFGDLPFPTPPMPGVDAAIATSAMDSIRKAALTCPQLAVPGGPLQNAAVIFGIFASTSDQQQALNTLQGELDRICPNWRGRDLGTPPSPPPTLPTDSGSITELLGQLASALLSGAVNELPNLSQRAKDLGLDDLAQDIDDYFQKRADAGPPPPPPPPTEPPPPTPPPPTTTKTKKKDDGISTGGLIAAGIAVLAVGAILFG